jgi:phage head maturation protease
MKTQHKAFSADVKISSEDERTVTAVISSNSCDREGDVLVPQGLNSKDFEANPVVLLLHSYYSLPVGKVVALKRTEDQVIAKIEFAARPEEHPFGEEWVPDTLFSLYKQGVMNAFSVGFIPTDSRAATSRDVTKYGEDCKQVVSRWRLLELSCVPIPCNQDAVATAVSKSLITQEVADVADKLFKVEEKDAEGADDSQKAAADPVDDGEKGAADTLPGDQKGVVDGAGDAIEPQIKEITREIAPAKRVAAVVEVNVPAEPVVKHVHRFIEPHQPDVAVKTHKVVVRTLSKLRGRVWVDED